MTVKRYSKDGYHAEHKDGPFVAFEDYAAIEARVETLQGELSALKKAASCVVRPWAEAKGAFAASDVAIPLGVAFEPMNIERFIDVTAYQLDELAKLAGAEE